MKQAQGSAGGVTRTDSRALGRVSGGALCLIAMLIAMPITPSIAAQPAEAPAAPKSLLPDVFDAPAIVNNAGLKPDQVSAISGGTAQKLFRIN